MGLITRLQFDPTSSSDGSIFPILMTDAITRLQGYASCSDG